MKIFEHIRNEDFFAPLIGKYRQLNCDAMDALMEASARTAHLYECETRAIIDDILLDYQDDEEIRRNRDLVYNRLKSCSWLDDSAIGRNGKPEVVLSEDAVYLMEFLHKRASESNGLRARDVHGIYEAAKRLDLGHGRPVQDGLLDMQDKIRSLRSALVNLRSSVRKKASDFVQQRTVTELIEHFKDKRVEHLFEEYQYIREGGFATAFFSKAKQYLDEFEIDEERMEKAALEYAMEKNVSREDAIEGLDNLIRSIGRFLTEDYRMLTDDIDQEINACNEAITSQLILAVRFGDDNQDLLVELLELLKSSDDDVAEEVLDLVTPMLPFQNMEYVSRASFEPREGSVKQKGVSFIEETALSDEERDAYAMALIEASESRLKRIGRYIEGSLGPNGKFVPSKDNVGCWEEAACLADVLAMAGESSEFFPYKVKTTGRIVETNCAKFTGMTVERIKQ